MTEKNEIAVFSETRGQYLIVKDGKYSQILFPAETKIEELMEYLDEVQRILKEAKEKQDSGKKEEVMKEPEVIVEE